MKHGVEMARSMAATKAERNAIGAAASIMGEEESRMGITHAGFAMTSLPHKRIEETVWRRSGPNTMLLVASGHTEQGRPIGVPYGSIARLILLYLQTEAIRTGSAEVELGRSMNAWLTKMNLAIGGKTYGLVAEQARRISHCRLTFFVDNTGMKISENGAFSPVGYRWPGFDVLLGLVGQPSLQNRRIVVVIGDAEFGDRSAQHLTGCRGVFVSRLTDVHLRMLQCLHPGQQVPPRGSWRASDVGDVTTLTGDRCGLLQLPRTAA